jgi:cytochrome P450 family 110
MSVSVAAPDTSLKPVYLNLLQQLRYFSEPLSMSGWLREQYGDFVPLAFGGHEYIGIASAEVARQVFSADPNGYEVFWKESFTALMGEESVWVIIGEKHRKERLLFSPAVHANHFRGYGSVIRDIARQHFGNWRAGTTIRAIDTTLGIALDVIMRLVFGARGEQEMNEGRKALSASTGNIHPLIVFFPALQRPWFPLWRRYASARQAMYAWTDKLIAARRAAGRNVQDVLGVLMDARDEDGNPVDSDYIHTELNSILSAGHETTAVALGWALYELGQHPEILKKLRDELEAAGPDPDPGLLLTLPYLDAVCKEAIRLHPVLAECARVPMQPMEIAGHHIPAGRSLAISIVSIHHDPELYPEPGIYRPERFLERNYSVYEFLPFGGGHRRCMGAGLAEYTMRIALAEAVMRWDFETAKKDKDIRRNIAMGPKHGIQLRIIGERATSA